MMMIWIISMILAFPSAYFSFILKFPHPNGGGGEIEICFPFPDELGPYYPKIVVMAKCIILYIIPLTIIGCCYISIAIHLMSKSKNAARASAGLVIAHTATVPAVPNSHSNSPAVGSLSAMTGKSLKACSNVVSFTGSSSNLTVSNNTISTTTVLKNTTRETASGEANVFKRSRKKTQSRAKMILLLVIIFLVTMAPNHLFMIWFYYHPHSQSLYNDFWHVLRIVAFCLTFLNSTLNPITLYLTSDQFKTLFNKYLWGCFFRSTALTTEVSDPSTVPADSPIYEEETCLKENLSDKNQNQRNTSRRTCLYTETMFQNEANESKVKSEESDRFGGVFVGEEVEKGAMEDNN